ncbi:PepSY domain-containing protein [Streptomyces sp. RS10V-4]|uniref:PepSY domain-containing protein n=1 Tax=Streptomyces rhizoryzae TaxID=2932493 RepID=UPI0020051028|nr:PepSY domain-containing protein [Streptomyces rhizoryzae]MCK7626046.1 PepSY domain-containing protein [Streptomyces rhizoryzae]
MTTSRIRRAFTGRRRLVVAAAAAVLAAGGTATAVAVTGGPDDLAEARVAAGGGPADTGRQRAVDTARTVVPGGRIVSVEPDHDHGTRVWEVELRTGGGTEHEVDVSMADGTVLSHSVDHDDHDDHGEDGGHEDHGGHGDRNGLLGEGD